MTVHRRLCRVLIVAAIAVMASSCATGYYSQRLRGGYQHTQVAEDVFFVSFRGNAFVGSTRAMDYALLRAAELALWSGHTHFAVTESNAGVRTGSYTTPVKTDTYASANVSGNRIYGSAHSTTTGGQTYNYTKPYVAMSIACLGGEPETDFPVYDATFLQESVMQKYPIRLLRVSLKRRIQTRLGWMPR